MVPRRERGKERGEEEREREGGGREGRRGGRKGGEEEHIERRMVGDKKTTASSAQQQLQL